MRIFAFLGLTPDLLKPESEDGVQESLLTALPVIVVHPGVLAP